MSLIAFTCPPPWFSTTSPKFTARPCGDTAQTPRIPVTARQIVALFTSVLLFVPQIPATPRHTCTAPGVPQLFGDPTATKYVRLRTSLTEACPQPPKCLRKFSLAEIPRH